MRGVYYIMKRNLTSGSFLKNILYTFINALLYKPEKNQKCERHYNKERNDSRSVLHQFMT